MTTVTSTIEERYVEWLFLTVTMVPDYLYGRPNKEIVLPVSHDAKKRLRYDEGHHLVG